MYCQHSGTEKTFEKYKSADILAITLNYLISNFWCSIFHLKKVGWHVVKWSEIQLHFVQVFSKDI